MKQKSVLVSIILLGVMMVVILSTVPEKLYSAGEAAKECTVWKSLITEVSGGTVEGC